MYIYQRISFDGSNWRSKSINTESLFDEDPYKNQTLPGKEGRFTYEPGKRLSSDVLINLLYEDNLMLTHE